MLLLGRHAGCRTLHGCRPPTAAAGACCGLAGACRTGLLMLQQTSAVLLCCRCAAALGGAWQRILIYKRRYYSQRHGDLLSGSIRSRFGGTQIKMQTLKMLPSGLSESRTIRKNVAVMIRVECTCLGGCILHTLKVLLLCPYPTSLAQ